MEVFARSKRGKLGYSFMIFNEGDFGFKGIPIKGNSLDKLRHLKTNVNEIYLRINEDKISDGDIVEQVLSNSKKNIFGYFTVPKVIE